MPRTFYPARAILTRVQAKNCRSVPHRFAVRRSDKDAFPTSPAIVAGRIESFRLPEQAQFWSVIHQTQYQAFVHFAADSCAAFLSHRAQKDLRFGTFSPGAGSRFENSGLDPYLSTGPVTLD
jgi:hypothetical protein